MFDNSDDYDFTPTQNSTLSSLFGSPMLSPKDANESLTYTAPKKTFVEKSEVKKSPQSSVLYAKIVLLWVLYVQTLAQLTACKHGLAIVEYKEENKYELIIYKEKNNILTRIGLSSNFKLILQEDNFFSFHDTTHKHWMIKFDNVEDKLSFFKEASKYKIPIEDYKPVKPQNTKPPDVIKPPSVSSQSSAETNSNINQNKANILSRITKMGQQILPVEKHQETSTEISDSDFEDSKTEKVTYPRKFIKKEKPHTSHQLVISQKEDIYSQPVQYQPQPVQYDSFSLLLNQNMEMKYALTQLNMKLDGITNNTQNDSQSKVKVLLLKLENVSSELEDYKLKYKKIQLENNNLKESKISEEAIERQNILMEELRNEADNNAMRQLKNELDDFKTQVNTQNLKLKDFEDFYKENKDNKTVKNQNEEQAKKIENLQLKLKDFEDYYHKNESEKAKHKITLQELNKQINDLKEKLGVLEEPQQNLNNSNINDQQLNAIKNLIKQCMNHTYESIAEHFNENEQYSSDQIVSTVAKGIKEGTYQIIQELPNCFKFNDKVV
ncbi:unnamed protein product [Brassicogethes aeneus]|uniref:Uncharacterized protein n=1 Tax=Brassicogethes aeneus TaxID=1431903 RepID=A0A9P0AYQ4_BRAAE|nr:unnamed protein product [Brassicogethes aeneus]